MSLPRSSGKLETASPAGCGVAGGAGVGAVGPGCYREFTSPSGSDLSSGFSGVVRPDLPVGPSLRLRRSRGGRIRARRAAPEVPAVVTLTPYLRRGSPVVAVVLGSSGARAASDAALHVRRRTSRPVVASAGGRRMEHLREVSVPPSAHRRRGPRPCPRPFPAPSPIPRTPAEPLEPAVLFYLSTPFAQAALPDSRPRVSRGPGRRRQWRSGPPPGK